MHSFSHLESDCSFQPGEDVIRWCPTFIGRFNPEPRHPRVGGPAVMASHCPSSPGPQLNSSLLFQSQQEALRLPPTYGQLSSSPFLLFPALSMCSTQTVLGSPCTRPLLGIARPAIPCPCTVGPGPGTWWLSSHGLRCIHLPMGWSARSG